MVMKWVEVFIVEIWVGKIYNFNRFNKSGEGWIQRGSLPKISLIHVIPKRKK